MVPCSPAFSITVAIESHSQFICEAFGIGCMYRSCGSTTYPLNLDCVGFVTCSPFAAPIHSDDVGLLHEGQEAGTLPAKPALQV
jgi:hypothetical protein